MKATNRNMSYHVSSVLDAMFTAPSSQAVSYCLQHFLPWNLM